MKSLLFFCIIALLSFPAIPSFAGKLLYIGYTDSRVIREAEHINNEAMYLQTRPKDEIIMVTLPKNLVNAEDEIVSNYFRDELIKLNLEDYSIDALILHTHGNSNIQEPNTFTFLQGMGKFSESSPSFLFTNTFAPLKQKLTPKARIVLNACKTFKGTDAQIEARAKVLMKFFGITDGLIYGSETSELSFLSSHTFYSRAGRAAATAWPQVVSVALQIHLRQFNPELIAFTGAISALAYYQFSSALKTKGSLIDFVNGNIAQHLHVNKINEDLLVYGMDTRPCDFYLGAQD